MMQELIMTETDLAQLRSQSKKDTILLICMILLIFIFWWIVNDNEFFGKSILILGAVAIVVSFLIRSAIYQDLIIKKKKCGKFKVVKKYKEKRFRTSDNTKYYYMYLIKFDDWRIGEYLFEENYWNIVSTGEIFEIEQAINSGFTLKIMRGLTDFKHGILNDYSDKKSILSR